MKVNHYRSSVVLIVLSSLLSGRGYAAPPGPPTGVSASDGSPRDKIVVTWNAPSRATKYIVYRAMTLSSGDAVAVSGEITGTSFEDSSTLQEYCGQTI